MLYLLTEALSSFHVFRKVSMCFWYHGLMSETSNSETVTKNLKLKKDKETVTTFLWHEMKQEKEKNISVVPAANINFGDRFYFWFSHKYKLVQQSINCLHFHKKNKKTKNKVQVYIISVPVCWSMNSLMEPAISSVAFWYFLTKRFCSIRISGRNLICRNSLSCKKKFR